MKNLVVLSVCTLLILASCNNQSKNKAMNDTLVEEKTRAVYATVRLNADLSHLSDNQKQMIRHMINAAKAMDQVFWMQSFGQPDSMLQALAAKPEDQHYFRVNYGPWDRLNGNGAFLDNYESKPLGARFYPEDMTKQEFEQWNQEGKDGLYSLVRRDLNGNLVLLPYHEAFDVAHEEAAQELLEAARLSEHQQFKKYLRLRAAALRSDEYQASDMAWMDLKNNDFDLVIGPIENYEDRLYGYKAAHEAFVLLKDREWSNRLQKYASMLPSLQEGMPVPAKYKAEKPGNDADLGAYDVLYYAGDCNAGSKTIAINLPNDEEVQLKKGSRRLQLKNAMRAKFDQILLPISEVVIHESQRELITFDAFFNNTMFHEVAHGLGIKNTINKKGTVRDALKEHYSALEEGKADILGLYMVNELIKSGELKADIREHMVTFMAGIFRSVRFGASSAHGVANMLRFNYFLENGAFYKTEDGTYIVDFNKMENAIASLSTKILQLQGDGDYNATAAWVQESGIIKSQLKADLRKIEDAGIPTDIIFDQGLEVLGL